MGKINSLTIFFPVLNDSFTIPMLVKKASIVAKKVAKSYEIIIIDDGSTDETPEVLKSLRRSYSSLRVITHKKTLGYGSALREGFTKATKEWVFYTDGDGQYDPYELDRLVKMIRPDIDVVNGYKISRSDPFVRVLLGSLYNRLLHILYDLPIRDVDCDFRLIRRRALQRVTLASKSGIICLELIVKLAFSGSKFIEVPVHHYPRTFGRSTFFNFRSLVQTAREHIVFCRYWRR